jgi:hypothetical protein
VLDTIVTVLGLVGGAPAQGWGETPRRFYHNSVPLSKAPWV